jgi:adenosylcobinamide kinase/adenosylcobinamide-phosphate guanylyltransferase
MSHLVLVTGGARSGKSRFAEARLAELAPSGPWLYVATAEQRDDEMRARVALHRQRRGPAWRTHEEPRLLAAALAQTGDARGILVDCLTLWLTNLLLDDLPDEAILVKCDEMADRARSTPVPVIVVTNEVGGGIVPDNALARRFRDLQGGLNQRIAALADQVVLLVAGLPLYVKGRPTE